LHLLLCSGVKLIFPTERTLKVFGHRVLRRIFETKRDEVTGGWRELHNGEFNNFYSSPEYYRPVANEWSYTSTTPYVFKARCLIKQSDNFAFNIHMCVHIRLISQTTQDVIIIYCLQFNEKFGLCVV
jgi:hypothetical protein